MRPPRVRITVGKSILFVGLAAANCGAGRQLYEMVENRHGSNPLWGLPIRLGVGFLPLLNVVLVGTLLHAARRVRSFRGGGGADRRPPSGFTFFGLHFLALGAVVVFLWPEAIEAYLGLLTPCSNYLQEKCELLFERYGDASPWLILECAILGTAISVPLLLVSGLGHLLARRCARTLPRGRFRVVTALVSLGFAGVAFAIAETPKPFYDFVEVPLDFRIVEQGSGRPIAGAFVRINDPIDRYREGAPAHAVSRAEGGARLTDRYLIDGVRNAFEMMGPFSPRGRWLEVFAPGFRTARIPLTDVLGPVADLERLAVRTVALTPGESPEDAFADLAGSYYGSSDGFSNRSFKIAADGRFSWIFSHCTGVDCLAYGYLSREGEELVLTPVREISPDAAAPCPPRLRVIRWGDCVYLGEADREGIRPFCRAALAPAGTRNRFRMHPGYLRASDHEKPQAGLPRLPLTAWAAYLRDEIDPRNDAGRLRLALESLSPWGRRSRDASL